MKVKSESEVACRVRLFTTPWTAAYQAPLSMGFSRQEYWSGLPLPSPILHIENTNESQVAQAGKTLPAMHVEGNRRNSYEKLSIGH